MESLTGHGMREMMAASTRLLEQQAHTIDSLNVFPVPDGDTGTNMLLTMRSSMAEASRCGDAGVGVVAQAMARGALMGARGNSGVILSQALRGIALSLKGKERLDCDSLAAALREAVSVAYKGVSKPVEGTILTVLRESATAAQAPGAHDLVQVMERVVAEARASVQRTPDLLPVLRQAGVVDAGGQGILAILEGAWRHLKGGEEEQAATVTHVSAAIASLAEEDYGYCTEFLLTGERLGLEAVREQLCQWGESVMVVGEDMLLRVHVHTHDPGRVLSYATSLGGVSQIKIENMLEQRREVVGSERAALPPMAVVAVALGEGLCRIFSSLGVSAVVSGGQTTNPSVEELLQVANSVPSDHVMLLPNNPNVIPAARQAAQLSRKRVEVIPSRSVPQGISALLAVSYQDSFEENLSRMEQSLARVKTGEVSRATRSSQWGGLNIKQGEALGLLEGEPAVIARTPVAALKALLSKMASEGDTLVTVYYSTDEDRVAAGSLRGWLRRRLPDLSLEMVSGGQPHYNYVLSVE